MYLDIFLFLIYLFFNSVFEDFYRIDGPLFLAKVILPIFFCQTFIYEFIENRTYLKNDIRSA